jgi:hypothetical protein
MSDVDLTGRSSNFLVQDLWSILDCHAGLDPALRNAEERFRIKSGMTNKVAPTGKSSNFLKEDLLSIVSFERSGLHPY